jgi:hypothetical protein
MRSSLCTETKSAAAEILLLLPRGVGLGLMPNNPLLTWVSPILAVVLLALIIY